MSGRSGHRIVLMASTDDSDGGSPPSALAAHADQRRSDTDYVAMEDAGNTGNTHSLPTAEGASSDRALRAAAASSDKRDSRAAAAPQSPPPPPRSSPVRPPRLLTTASSPDDSSDLSQPPHLNRHFLLDLIAWYRNRSWQKKVLTVLVFATACLVYADLFGFFWPDSKIHAGLEWFLDWMDQNSIEAVFAFIGVFILTTLIFVPPFIMTFGAGFVFVEVYGFAWGIALAMAACFAGSSIGAVIAFLRARYMTRDLVKIFAERYPLIRAVDRGLKRSGFKVMLLLRLCSIIPFSALNYIGGVTGVQLWHFICSLVGILPSLLLTVFFGATAGSIKNSDINADFTLENIIWLSVTGACGLLAVLLTIYFARKEIKKELERDDPVERSLGGESPVCSSDEDLPEQGIEAGPRDQRQRKSEEWWWVWA